MFQCWRLFYSSKVKTNPENQNTSHLVMCLYQYIYIQNNVSIIICTKWSWLVTIHWKCIHWRQLFHYWYLDTKCIAWDPILKNVNPNHDTFAHNYETTVMNTSTNCPLKLCNHTYNSHFLLSSAERVMLLSLMCRVSNRRWHAYIRISKVHIIMFTNEAKGSEWNRLWTLQQIVCNLYLGQKCRLQLYILAIEQPTVLYVL